MVDLVDDFFVWIKMDENGLLWLGGVILRKKKTVEDNRWNFSQDVDCWEIAWNSICDLKIQLGFLVEEWKFNLGFLCVEGKTISLCDMKVYYLLKK